MQSNCDSGFGELRPSCIKLEKQNTPSGQHDSGELGSLGLTASVAHC